MSTKPTETTNTAQDVQPIHYLKTLYFLTIVLPYAFAVYSIFHAPNFTIIMQFTLSIVLGLAWHGVARPLFERKLAAPYKDTFYAQLFSVMQYPIATFTIHFLVTYLTAISS